MLKKKKKFELPHVYTIAFLLIILFAILTWIVPSGQFERTMMETAGVKLPWQAPIRRFRRWTPRATICARAWALF